MRPIIALMVIALFATIVRAEEESPEREKVKKNLLLPQCSWSKMSKSEYEACQKQRDTMEVMTPAERAKYQEHLDGDQVVVDGKRGNTLRNVARNLPAGGRK